MTLAEKVFESDPQKSKAALSLARDFARQSIADVRFALQALRSDKLRMDEAVGRLVEDLEKVHSVKVTAVMTWPALNTEQAHHLYCIIRECLNNTQKYAQAKEISIEAFHDSECLNVLIKDDGQGFDPSLPRDGSYGLMGASERLAQLGGSFSVQSSPGAGTVVSIKLPL
ncbi:MAG TPA: ATP-binding protein [Candidatus Obscuribacter sp.]|nr:ATP-binding protein [Candidatus Obscuribacter sp.]